MIGSFKYIYRDERNNDPVDDVISGNFHLPTKCHQGWSGYFDKLFPIL
jgi:hypothetical protein